MLLKEFSSYLKRPFESFERIQIENFKKVFEIVNSSKEPTKDYEFDVVGFLNPHDNSFVNRMRQIIESQFEGYTLFLLFDIPMRRTNNILECLLPTQLVKQLGIENSHNVCIQFKKFKKKYVTYKSKHDISGKWLVMVIDDFEIVNPLKLRTVSSKESKEAQNLRNDILFREVDVNLPSYVKMSILSSLFLSPKIRSRSGIESKAFLSDSVTGRALINLDIYNSLMTNLIPPEISNCHYSHYQGDNVPHYISHLGKDVELNMQYPPSNYYFHASCTPNYKEDQNITLRDLSKNELGINHQTKIQNYLTNKEVIDKLMTTEFFYSQEYLPKMAINKMDKSQKLIDLNKELLYNDYATRMFKQITSEARTVSEKHKITDLANQYCEKIKYTPKQSNDSYFNSVFRSISENLARVKSILPRSMLKEDNNGSRYLMDIELNFLEITELKDYNTLPTQKANIELIRKIMNNRTRSMIIEGLKVRNNIALEQDIINELIPLGHEEQNIRKEILNLMKGGFIYKTRDVLYLISREV